MRGNLYEIVAQKIVEALCNGVIPWRQPWDSPVRMPVNLVTNRSFRGVNPWLLLSAGYSDHRWLTERQVTEVGGHIRPGEQPTMVVYWQFPENVSDKSTVAPTLYRSEVFNVEQLGGVNLPKPIAKPLEGVLDRLKRADLLTCSMPRPPFIEEHGLEAWYDPSLDVIRIPDLMQLPSIDAYYLTKYHELIHSTGHTSRLNRPNVMNEIHFGSEGYSREELVAELGAARCCAIASLDNSPIANPGSYIAGWLGKLQADPKAMVVCAAQAQKAADYIQGISYL